MAELSRLPGPIADLYEWQNNGSCREADPALFFHPEFERGPSRRKRENAARAVCSGCPVLQACRAHALKVREPYGVWGGLTEEDREVIYAAERRERRGQRANGKDTTKRDGPPERIQLTQAG
jgi:WhiB family transcriptional regulator, redox-sensing transcriptional regulator